MSCFVLFESDFPTFVRVEGGVSRYLQITNGYDFYPLCIVILLIAICYLPPMYYL